MLIFDAFVGVGLTVLLFILLFIVISPWLAMYDSRPTPELP